MKILVSIVTRDKNYLNKIQELKNFKIKEVALFFAIFGTRQVRKKIYKELIKIGVKNVPFVHLRDDMKLSEVEYLMKTFNTKMFNTHPTGYFEVKDKNILKKYKNKVYLENSEIGDAFKFEDEISCFAGICLDVAHLENSIRLKERSGKKILTILDKYKCGVWHVSAIKKQKYYSKHCNDFIYDSHKFKSLNEFDYLKKYKRYLPYYIAFEVENSIEDQLKAKKYLNKILK